MGVLVKLDDNRNPFLMVMSLAHQSCSIPSFVILFHLEKSINTK